ncbi:hypothetical protein OG306_33165 [Streptomyces sp. NBC_01241]|uniref:hypothetical protein n=1 Tax=Streptomyces sp. NBC_01241 TaxID=2903794 RepID=UPI00352C1410|nr:hypothetical protein OG306_33165 [Streptomyces sp. NBC_01241]
MALDEATEWGPESYLLARLSDGQELSNYLFIQANSAENAESMPLPTPVQRPGESEPEPQKTKPEDFASGQEVAAFFGKMSSL